MNLGLLPSAWSALGGPEGRVGAIRLEGDPYGLLPSPLRAFDAMASAIGAALLAAAELHEARTERSVDQIRLTSDEVALAAISERLARRQGGQPPDLFAPLSRFWKASDGWVRLHGNYPWHRDRALKVLGCEASSEAVTSAVAEWGAVDLEEALASAGALGYAVRTPAEWKDHPQGRAVAERPLVEITLRGPTGRQLGAGPVASGARVLDLTRVIAGPVATRTLAAWGADVLRLDAPHLPEIEDQTIDTLSGKRSALLDLAADRLKLEELLGRADLLVCGYRPGALSRFGLHPDDLAERHPHLGVVTVSAWGETGPWGERRGFDSLVQCPTGIAALTGASDRPGTLPAQILDHATGYLAAAAGFLSLAVSQRGEPVITARLALAATAHWLLSAGAGPEHPVRRPGPEEHIVTLAGPREAVEVIRPPGRIADRRPNWRATTRIGADPPSFTA